MSSRSAHRLRPAFRLALLIYLATAAASLAQVKTDPFARTLYDLTARRESGGRKGAHSIQGSAVTPSSLDSSGMGVPYRIILYGGSFCPPHLGHIREARAACSLLGAHQTVFLPAAPEAIQYEAVRRSKNWIGVTAHQRLAMTWLATAGYGDLGVSTHEVVQTEPGYSTSRSVLEISANTDAEIWLLVGIDVFRGMSRWESAPHVFAAVNVLVSEYGSDRLDDLRSCLPAEIASDYKAAGPRLWQSRTGRNRKIRIARLEDQGLSSSRVWREARRGDPIEPLVGSLVAQYMERYLSKQMEAVD